MSRLSEDQVGIAERERIEESLISVREVLAYLVQDCYLNLTEASEYLSISTRSIRDRLDGIPHYRVGSKLLLFKKSELDTWMEQHRVWPEDVEGLVDDVLGKIGE